ncbi:MAG: LPS-assembly protein LptD [Phycisphaerales bacterium]|nr:LPS-assembly protein LptD [Phycisphaerales bacterium]
MSDTQPRLALPARARTDGPLRRLRVAAALLALIPIALPFPPSFETAVLPRAIAQDYTEDELLVPDAISSADVEMQGAHCRQWRLESGEAVLVYSGRFRLNIGKRQMSAAEAVVWIDTEREEGTDRPVFSLTVYLSEDAELIEPAGTITQDNVLLVSGIRTTGRVIKRHDAHAEGSGEQNPLFRRATEDRRRIEEALRQPVDESPAGRVVRGADADAARIRRPPRPVRYRVAGIEPARTPQGEQVLVMSGPVSFLQSGSTDAATLEITADRAVVFPSARAAGSLLDRAEEQGGASASSGAQGDGSGASSGGSQSRPEEGAAPEGRPTTDPAAPAAADSPGARGGEEQIEQFVRAVYLEGDVVLSLGDRFVRAERLYYDFEMDRALILDAVFRAEMPERGIPLYIRAATVRQLSPREFSATSAVVTTSEFHTPHYHIGAERVIVRDSTQRDAGGSAVGSVRGAYELHNTTLNVENVPLLWWPYSQGDFTGTETALRGFRFSYGGRRGVTTQTEWDLYALAGARKPPGHDARMMIDYFGRRGPAFGLDYDYAGTDHYGLFRSYYLYDQGEDNLGPLRRAQEIPENANRGRTLWRHRHFLPNDWELSLEVSYISDPNFLEEWRKSEFQEGKQQETLLYLKRARGNEAISFLANWRILDYTTQTEHLPDLAYRRIGDTFLDPLVLHTEARVGSVRYRPDDRRFLDEFRFDNLARTDVTFRADGRQEVELPLKLGGVNVVPFVTGRAGYWDGQPLDRGGLWRGLGVFGLRASTMFSRVFTDARSELLDVDGIRHVIKPDVAAWGAVSNTRSELITPFDYGIETVDDFYGVTFGLRQTWQTRRGEGSRRRTVDLLTFNVEAGLFGDVEGRSDFSNGYANPLRPENSRPRNYIGAEAAYRVSDTMALLYDANYDLSDQAFDRQAVSLAIERPPRAAYLIGLRYAGDINMNLIGGGFNYQLSEKYTLSSRAWFDIDTGDFGEGSIAVVRKLPRWYLALNFEYSDVDDDFSMTVSLWPEGIPEWTIGSRRFTQLGTSTGIRP